MPSLGIGAGARRGLARTRVRYALAAVAGAAATAGVAAAVYIHLRRVWRERRARDCLERWCASGPAQEPVIECEVPIAHGAGGEEPECDIVYVPVGLVFECERIQATLQERLGVEDEAALIEALQSYFAAGEEHKDNAEGQAPADPDESAELPVLSLPWVDLAALAQLTYWYDRRPQGDEEEPAQAVKVARLSEAKFGRWTKKLSREKVIYGTVALRYRSRGHLGQQVFRRPAGVDVTRLATLRRAAALCGHGPLLNLVEETMELLKPKNVARIPWSEVRNHTSKDDLWLLIDGKVYDVTPFLDLHPGGGQLIADAAGKDATSLFERTHGEGLRYSLRLLNQFFIGVCEGAAEAEPAEPAVATPEFLDTLRSITGALHTFDEARATGEAQGMLR